MFRFRLTFLNVKMKKYFTQTDTHTDKVLAPIIYFILLSKVVICLLFGHWAAKGAAHEGNDKINTTFSLVLRTFQ